MSQNKVEVRELGIATPAQGAAVVAKFARNVFDHADTEDRLGSPNGSTVQSLIAASVFMDSLKFFAKDLGDKGTALLQEFGMKAKFAKFRAAEIARAMKAGAPVPPRQDAMGAEPSLDEMFVGLPSVPSASASQAFATAPVPAPYTAPAPAPYTASAPAPYTAPAPAPYTAPAPVPYTAPVSAGGEISGKDQAEAQKHAKYAAQNCSNGCDLQGCRKEPSQILEHRICCHH